MSAKKLSYYFPRYRNQRAHDSRQKPFASSYQLDRTHQLALKCPILAISLYKLIVYLFAYDFT